MDIVAGRPLLFPLAVACIARMGIEAHPVSAQSVESSGLEFPSDGSYLRLQASGNEAHQALDGYRMKRAVDVPPGVVPLPMLDIEASVVPEVGAF